MSESTTFPLTQVPLPPKPKLGNPNFPKKAPMYPWATMKVGDSFFVPLVKGKSFTSHNSQMKRHPNNGKYETRRVVEDGTTGVRVWRTK